MTSIIDEIMEDRLEDYEREDGDDVVYEACDKRFLDTVSKFRHSEDGSVSWYVRVTSYKSRNKDKETKHYTRTDAHASLGDCYRKISWTLNCNSPKEFSARIAKVDQAVESLIKLRAALAAAKAASDEYLASIPAEPEDDANG